MQPTQLEGQSLNSGDRIPSCCGVQRISKNTCRYLAFVLPCVLVIVINTVESWLESPLFTAASLYASFLVSIVPGLLAGIVGLVLYTAIKFLKRRLRSHRPEVFKNGASGA
jgi:hypothetical protein